MLSGQGRPLDNGGAGWEETPMQRVRVGRDERRGTQMGWEPLGSWEWKKDGTEGPPKEGQCLKTGERRLPLPLACLCLRTPQADRAVRDSL